MTAAKRKASARKPIWIDFAHGKVRARLVRDGAKMSVVEYLEAVKLPTYEAKKGEERRVANIFITPRR